MVLVEGNDGKIIMAKLGQESQLVDVKDRKWQIKFQQLS